MEKLLDEVQLPEGGCYEEQLMPRGSWLRCTWMMMFVMRSS